MEILKNLESKIYPVETIMGSLKNKNKKEKIEFVYRIKSYKGRNFLKKRKIRIIKISEKNEVFKRKQTQILTL